MTCVDVDRELLIERYVHGILNDVARSELEDHYFNCQRCTQKINRVGQILVRLNNIHVNLEGS